MPAPKRKATGARKNAARDATPIHNMQKKLAEEQARLTQEKMQLERFLADAPRRAEEEERRRRDELIERASQGSRRMGSRDALPDTRYHADTLSPPRRTKGLRSHRRAARLQFFALLILLGVLVIVLVRHMP